MAKLNFFCGEDRETHEYRAYLEAFDDTHAPVRLLEITADGRLIINASIALGDMSLEEMGIQTEGEPTKSIKIQYQEQ